MPGNPRRYGLRHDEAQECGNRPDLSNVQRSYRLECPHELLDSGDVDEPVRGVQRRAREGLRTRVTGVFEVHLRESTEEVGRKVAADLIDSAKHQSFVSE